MRNDRGNNLILDKSLEFAVLIIHYTEFISSTKRFSLANQLFKSGTSIGANVREAQNSESDPDFIHKMKIAAKEVDETDYWLTLCNEIPEIKVPEGMKEKLGDIMRIVSKIIGTMKRKSMFDDNRNSSVQKE